MIEQAWEDDKGHCKDEPAEIQWIDKKTGEMGLHFYEATDEVNDFLKGAEFFAKDYEKAKLN